MIGILEALNDAQKQSAQKTDGALMVVAGPGTGKTHTLASRIAFSLASDQGIEPRMILCLTYTEAGVVAMRRRLVEIIGTEAYKIAIHTFHSFCNEVIQNNPDYFGIKLFEPVSELERLEIAYEIIEAIPKDNELKRLKGDIYWDSRRLLNLWQLMKEEHWTLEHVKNKALEYINDLPYREEYIYKRNNPKTNSFKGDVKKALVVKEEAKMMLLIRGAELLEKYNEFLMVNERYDFSDMLLWVLNAWEKDDYFLLNYQERYQYVLVDEFQDTNKMQFDLLNKLMDYWDNPNIFAVGDADQCLYAFNGARLQNVIDFASKYNPELVVLTENYRSNQLILDRASNVINNNTIRISNTPYFTGKVQTELIAATNKGDVVPIVKEFPNITMETASIVDYIDSQKTMENDISEIAIIYRKHKQADDLIRQFEARGIPYHVKRAINVLDTTIITQILDMIKLVVAYNKLNEATYGNYFFRILHFAYFNNDISKIHKYYLSLQTSERSRKPNDIIKTDEIFDELVTMYHRIPLINFVEQLMEKTGLMKWVLEQDNKLQLLQYINTFFGWVKGEAFRNPVLLNGEKLLDMIEKMRINGLYLSVVDVQGNSQGVNLMTVHGAKGLEFNEVIMMACTRNEWEKSRAMASTFSIPDTLTLSRGGEDKIEENRRLWFVGMTRAMRRLTISYSLKNSEDKELEPSQFITETGLAVNKVPTVNLDEYLKFKFQMNEIKFDFERDMIKEKLEQFVLSFSAMNKYLLCSVAFYYENILRVPFVATPPLIYGNAIHMTMKKLYDSIKAKINLTFDELFHTFAEYLHKNRAQMSDVEVELRKILGRKVIKFIMDDYYPKSNKITLNEYKIKRVVIDGVPCKGDIDKIEFNGTMAKLCDYKTGNPVNAVKKMKGIDAKNPNGGDYWQQKVFYKIIFDAIPGKEWGFNGYRMDALHEAGVTSVEADVERDEELHVRKLIVSTYEKIMNMEFSEGCGEPECIWCNLSSN